MKILVIDNVEIEKNKICDFFNLADCEVLHALNGLEGLVSAMKHLPDVVISEVKVPIVNGFQLYKFLKMNPKTENIPLVLFSGTANKHKMEFALKLGIKHYFVKPFDMEKIYNTVKNIAG